MPKGTLQTVSSSVGLQSADCGRNERYYPLHYACGEGHVEITKFLIEDCGEGSQESKVVVVEVMKAF